MIVTVMDMYCVGIPCEQDSVALNHFLGTSVFLHYVNELH